MKVLVTVWLVAMLTACSTTDVAGVLNCRSVDIGGDSHHNSCTGRTKKVVVDTEEVLKKPDPKMETGEGSLE